MTSDISWEEIISFFISATYVSLYYSWNIPSPCRREIEPKQTHKCKHTLNQTQSCMLPLPRGQLTQHLVAASQWPFQLISCFHVLEKLANRAELCNSMQLWAFTHKSLPVLNLRRLKLSECPPWKQHMGVGTASSFSFVLHSARKKDWIFKTLFLNFDLLFGEMQS